MSYYGISVAITVIVTSLIAFYLLYKAKELNLGILISISIGSLILGFSFNPAFKAVLNLLSDSVSLNKQLALIITLLVELFVFLLLICILSLVISIAIPKRFSSIDCGAVIDRFLLIIKTNISSFIHKISVFTGGFFHRMKDMLLFVYNLKNKLKKPVDTKQIIDTMGIEKNENGIFEHKENNTDSFAGILAFMEPHNVNRLETVDLREAVEEVTEAVAVSTEADIEDIIGKSDLDQKYQNIVAMAYSEVIVTEDEEQDVVETSTSELLAESEDIGVTEILDTIQDSGITESDNLSLDNNTIENTTIALDTEAEVTVSVNEEETTDETEIISNIHIESANTKGVVEQFVYDTDDWSEDIAEVNADSLVMKAFECKDNGRKDQAVEYYMEALQRDPDRDMIFWIVLDVCTLYKQMGLNDLAQMILEGMVQKYGSIIQPEMKQEIMKNLK